MFVLTHLIFGGNFEVVDVLQSFSLCFGFRHCPPFPCYTVLVYNSYIPIQQNIMGDACFSTQLIDGDGVFSVSGLDNFMKEIKLGECGLSYAVVSIMGPQSSGTGFLLFFSIFP